MVGGVLFIAYDENAIYTVRAVYENGISDYERNGISVNSCLDLDHGTMK